MNKLDKALGLFAIAIDVISLIGLIIAPIFNKAGIDAYFIFYKCWVIANVLIIGLCLALLFLITMKSGRKNDHE